MKGKAANLFLAMVWGVLAFLCFQGRGSHALFVGIAMVPLLFRKDLKSCYAQRKKELEAFQKSREAKAIPWKAVFSFAVIPMLFLSLSNGRNIPSYDNYGTSLVGASVALEGNTELSEHLEPGKPMPYYLRTTSKGVYSAYPVGMWLVSIPFSIVCRMVGGKIGEGKAQWRLAKWAGAWVAAVCAGAFLLLALLLGNVPGALISTAFLIVGSSFLSIIGQGLWTHGGVTLGFLLCLLCEFLTFKKVSTKVILQSFFIAWMLSSRLTSALFIVPFGVWLMTVSWRRAFATALVSFLWVLPVGIYQYLVYDNFFGPQMLLTQSFGFHFEPLRVYGNYFGPASGWFIYQPWMFLGLLWLGKRKGPPLPKYFSALLVSIILLHTYLICSWTGWWGAIWGARYFTEVTPLYALLLLGVFSQLSRRVFIGFALLSFLIQANGVYGKGGRWFYDPPQNKSYTTEEARMYDWSDTPLIYPWSRNLIDRQ